LLAVFGPGLLAMLADADVGSVITAGQSGAQWGYRLLALQFVLVPVLYMAQELTARLGIFTGRGYGELVREVFGPVWAWISVTGLIVAVFGALTTEFSGVAGVGELYGLPRLVSLPIAAAGLLAIVLTGSYRRVERIAIAVGLFELAFLFVAFAARPKVSALLSAGFDIPYANRDYLYLVAANVGTLVTPCMIFYQQSAVVDKRLRPEHYAAARIDTAVGALLCQVIMAAVLIACAATIGREGSGASLSSVGEMSAALTPFLGVTVGGLIFGIGVLGAGLVAAIVVSLALAWGMGEITGYRHSLEHHPLRARWFYGIYTSCVIGGAVLVAIWPDLVALNIAVQVVNVLIMPVILGLLIALAARALPPSCRLRGVYLWVVVIVWTVTCALGLFSGFSGAGLLG
jgi:Mn2+/Fe2+ NRAMP family transporter